jgi:hypothetical protein
MRERVCVCSGVLEARKRGWLENNRGEAMGIKETIESCVCGRVWNGGGGGGCRIKKEACNSNRNAKVKKQKDNYNYRYESVG